MPRFESVPPNVGKLKQKKTTEIPLSHEPERKQMESADAPKISFTPRKQVRGAAVPHLLHSGVPWSEIMNFMRAVSNKSASNLWMKERQFVVRSQEGVKEHAHQINFPAKPLENTVLRHSGQRCWFPTSPQRHSCERQKRLCLRVTATKPWALARKITVTDFGEKGRCHAASSANSCTPLPPYSETRDHHPHTRPQKRYGNLPAGGRRGIQAQCYGKFPQWAEIENTWFQETLKVEKKAACGKRTKRNSYGKWGPDEVPELMIYQDNQKSQTGEWRALNSCLASFAD